MSLKKVNDILENVQRSNYAVSAFNVVNFESIAWLIETAEEENI